MLSPDSRDPKRPPQTAPEAAHAPVSMARLRQSFLQSEVGREIERGRFVLKSFPFFFASGAVHFPDLEAKQAIQSAVKNAEQASTKPNNHTSNRTELDAPLLSYFDRLKDVYAVNAMSRRPLMMVSGPNRYQNALLELSPAFGLTARNDQSLSEAFHYVLQPWRILISEHFATKSSVARGELAWLEFVRSVGDPQTTQEVRSQEVFMGGMSLISEFLAADGGSLARTMQFAGLDTSLFSKLSLWYFHTAPDTLGIRARSKPGQLLAKDHMMRCLFFRGIVRDAFSYHAARNNYDGCEVLRECSKVAATLHAAARESTERFVRQL